MACTKENPCPVPCYGHIRGCPYVTPRNVEDLERELGHGGAYPAGHAGETGGAQHEPDRGGA